MNLKKTNLSFFINLILLLGIFIYNCKVEKWRPEGIPKKAVYDKKRNVYTHIENGIRKIWVETGELYSECQVDELGREHGECKNYFPKTGKLITEGKSIHGERDGVWYWYFPNGQVYYKLTLAHDKKRPVWIETNLLGNEHGLYERFYEDGNLDERGMYDSGYRMGSWEKYYRNGNVEFRGNYKKDKKIGDWKYYYIDGKLEIEEKFTEEGVLVYRKTFFPDGSLACEIEPAKNKNQCNSPI
jgi:antitoxin component YwqK of YwqJK toxin-antitoxin module